MKQVDEAYRAMDFEFFGGGKHKTSPGAFFDQENAVLVDVRSLQEFLVLPVLMDWVSTLHIPLHELPERWEEIPKDVPVGLFCSSDTRSAMAFAYLRARGYESARVLMGGYHALVDELKPGKVMKRSTAEG